MFEVFLVVAWLATVFGFLAYLNVREKAIDAERSKLLMHIQAPESATLAYAREHDGKPEPVPTLALDDDEGYEALRLRREGSVAD